MGERLQNEVIGGYKLNYRFYSGQDLYSDGDIEEQMLNICKEKRIDEALREGDSWPILYHFSKARENLPGCGDPAAGHAVLLESAEGDEEEKRSGVRGGFLGGTLRRAAGVFPGGTHWRLSRPSRAPYKSGMKMIAPQ